MSPGKIIKFAIGPVGLGVLGFVSVPLVSWFFPPEDLGVFAMLQVSQGIGLMLFSLGLDQAYAREYHQTSKRATLFIRCVAPGFSLLLALLLLAAVYGFANFSFLIYGVSDPYLGLITWLCLLFGFIVRYISLLLRMNEKALQFSFTQLLPKIVFLLTVLAISTSELPRTYLGLSAAHAAGYVVSAFIFVYVTRSLWNTDSWTVEEQIRYGNLFQYALPLVATGVAAWGLKAIDKISLRAFSTLSELGIYSVAVTVAGGVAILTSVFNTIWSPIVYKMAANGSSKDELVFAGCMVEFFIFLLFMLTGLFAWMVRYLVPVQYAAVDILIPLCVFAPLIYSLSEAMTIGINLSRKTGYAFVATAIAFACGGLLNYTLVPKLGAVGAAIATATAFYIYFILRFELACVVWNKQPRLRIYLMVLVCLSLAIFNALIPESYPFGSEASWFLVGAIGLFFYRKEVKYAVTGIKVLRRGVLK